MFRTLIRDLLLDASPPEAPLPPFDLVRASEVHAAFAEESRLEEHGFTELRIGVFARSASPTITHVVQLKALKALQYAPWWGVSLSYLPTIERGKLRYHRTLKSARFSLYDEPSEFFGLRPGHRVPGTFSASIGYGVEHMRETMAEMWGTLRAPVEEWLDATSSLEGVCRRCEEQLRRTWLGAMHRPHPNLVLSFSEAEAGRPDAARESLAAYLDAARVTDEEERLLRGALEGTPGSTERADQTELTR